ncbi:aminodeoxychorismate lyase ABZ2 PWA37_001193 [Arxiozyma heterogenica]|uniref:Aminodeoxychorismate lyase n=1 Tax=Arxiozyma heterogenica TaxID=278026 RepID=A0AAN7ZXF4_9SACH|nr:hypothetical protein RI543_003834 [Kazachstania heterogenica]
MIGEYQILSTLRYDSNLAKLEGITLNTDNDLVVQYSTVNDDFLLDTKCNGYEWKAEMIQDGTKDFHIFQKEFSQVNNISLTKLSLPLDSIKNFDDRIIVDATYMDFIQSRCLFVPQHLARINLALKYFDCPREPLTLNELLTLLIDTFIDKSKTLMDNLKEMGNVSNSQIYKIRILIDKNGHVITEAHPLNLSSEHTTSKTCTQYFYKTLLNGLCETSNNIWSIFKDIEPITSTTPYTTFKTTNRLHYTLARERMMRMITKSNNTYLNKTKCEILLFNQSSFVMEGSITNIAVSRKNKQNRIQWITPPLRSGCLCGIFRYYLLRMGYIEEDDIKLNEINIGDTILIFNGVMGCVKAIVTK